MRFGRQGTVYFFELKPPDSRNFGSLGLAVRFIINVAALWLAQALIRGFDIQTAGALLFGAVIFGTVNAFVKPIVSMLSCALTCATLGVFSLIINTLMLALTAWIAGIFDLRFEVDGFIAAFLGALVISITSSILSTWADSAILRPSIRDRYDEF